MARVFRGHFGFVVDDVHDEHVDGSRYPWPSRCDGAGDARDGSADADGYANGTFRSCVCNVGHHDGGNDVANNGANAAKLRRPDQ